MAFGRRRVAHLRYDLTDITRVGRHAGISVFGGRTSSRSGRTKKIIERTVAGGIVLRLDAYQLCNTLPEGIDDSSVLVKLHPALVA